MWKQIFDSVLSKLGEVIADRAHDNVNNINNFKLNLETLQESLNLLKAKLADVEKEIKNAEGSGRKKRKREVEEWLGAVELIETEVGELLIEEESEGFLSRFMDGGKATRLNERVKKLIEQRQQFGELVLDHTTKGETLPATRMVGGAFQQNFRRILTLLETVEVSSIGVYGMGGAGKTTLTKHIYNRLLKESKVGVFWVTVSHGFTIRSLQDKVALSLGEKELFDGEDDEIIRSGKLQRALSDKEKNSVLILDDVWEYINLLKVGFPLFEGCCRLIITTRSKKVCELIGCKENIPVVKLGEEEAWKLFNETLGKEVIKLGSQVEEIAKSVAKLCGGLPLGIITLAGSMRGETCIRTWRNTLLELKKCVSGVDGMEEFDEVFQILKHSFDRLNKHDQSESDGFNPFQLCFLHCSLYPEDHKIGKDRLVEEFISEGLVDGMKSRRAQVDKGHVILDKLVKVCLLESCVNDEGVKMHDLVRGMALKIGGGKYMVQAGDYSLKEIPMEEEWTQDLEKVSLMNNAIWRIPGEISPNCPKLSTLLLMKNPLEFIPDSFFSKMQVLCTLDLSGTTIKMLPRCLSDMKSLKALNLGNCNRLEDVPYLGKLKALRELDLSHAAIKEVPRGVEELLNLKFLSLRGAYKVKVIRRRLLLKLVHLQCVRFPDHLHETTIEGIENLRQLEEFVGTIRIDEHEFDRFITNRVHDTSYSIRVGSVVHECCSPYYKKAVRMSGCNIKEEMQKYEKAIEWIFTSEQELQISSVENIWLSELEELKGVIEKGEIGASAVFSSLRSLHIYGCNKMKKLGLSVLASQNLQHINIWNCREIEEILEDEGEGSSVALPKLKKLSLYRLPRLKSVCKATIICDSIETIWIQECPRLINKLPLHLEMDVSPPPSLRKIRVERKWWESLEWDNPNFPHLLQPLVIFFGQS